MERKQPDAEHRKKRRRRALVYRPSPDNLPGERPDLRGNESPTSSPGTGGLRMDRHPFCLISSPLERQHRKVLAVELEDISQELGILHSRSDGYEEPPAGAHSLVSSSCLEPRCLSGYRASEMRIRVPEDNVAGSDSSPSATLTPHSCHAPLPDFCRHSSRDVPPSPPKTSRWSLAPLLNSVRSKLESFADIFLTPIKNRRNAETKEKPSSSEQDDRRGQRPHGVEGDLERSHEVGGIQSSDIQANGLWEHCAASADCPPCEQGSLITARFTPSPGDSLHLQPRKDGKALGEKTSRGPFTTPPSRTDLKFRLSPVLCRSPLQRCFSCPSLPLSPALMAPSSAPAGLSVLGGSGELVLHPCTPHGTRRPHRRRHSVGTLEERSGEMPPSILSLSCLRKERHPFLLCHSLSAEFCRQQDQFGKRHALASTLFDSLSSRSPGVITTSFRQQIPQSPCEPESVGDSASKQESRISADVRKVSDFQIRKRPTRQEGNLTPLGLPKRARLQKEEFSLEEIYTNKNYRTPTEKRAFETIFEEPVLRGGSLVLTSQRPLKRIIVFQDCSVRHRKRRKKRKGCARSQSRKTGCAEKELELEHLLEDKLAQLEAALHEQEDIQVS
uniref:Tantalus-like domain-containing protein n=1 Tax=Leptobrachium leishanense TaxID=445787 RepID=A0A8C5Q6E8_9ANUR